jgi:hypothetical protein
METLDWRLSLVPTLRVGMPVRDARRPVPPLDAERLSYIPTRSVGTRRIVVSNTSPLRYFLSFPRSAWECRFGTLGVPCHHSTRSV